MKKITMLLVLCFFLSVGAGMAAAAPTLEINHESDALLVDNKTVYDNAFFRCISFRVWEDRTHTESDKTHTGTLIIQKGTYSLDKAGKWVDVIEQDKIFDLKYAYGDSTNVAFAPWTDGGFTEFYKAAESGLNGKGFSWSVLGSIGSGTIHNFRTTQAQLTSYAPYAEITASGITFRMVKSSDPSKAAGVPFTGSYAADAFDIDGNRIAKSEPVDCNANEAVSGTIPLSAEALQKISFIRVRARVYENPANSDYLYNYVWFFWRTVKTNEGVADESALVPLKLKVGEQATFSVVFKPDYFGIDSTRVQMKTPLIIGDKSLVETSWTYDSNTRTYSVTVKGLKSGTTDLSIYYEKKYDGYGTTTDYRTVPVQVTVEGPSGGGSCCSDSGGSGGGCDAGFGLLAFAIAGAVVLREKK